MNKKEFYEAPKWGTRVVMVERQFLQNPSQTGIPSFDENDVNDDTDGWGR